MMPSARRFPPPWTIEEMNDACFIVRDKNGHALAGSGSHLFLAACFAGAGSLGSCRPGAYHRVDGVTDVLSNFIRRRGTCHIEDLTQHAHSQPGCNQLFCSKVQDSLIETNPRLVRAFKHAAIRFNNSPRPAA